MSLKLKFSLKEAGPIEQGLIVLPLIILVTFVCFVIKIKSIYAWNFLLVPLLLYCVYNAVFSIFYKNLVPYLGLSVLVFSILCFTVYISGNLVSSISFKNSLEIRTIANLLPLFYVMFYFFCLVFRFVLQFLQDIDK